MPQVKLLVISEATELVQEKESTTLELSQEIYGFLCLKIPKDWEREIASLGFKKAVPLNYGNRQKLKAIALECRRLAGARPASYPAGKELDTLVSRLLDKKTSYLQLQ